MCAQGSRYRDSVSIVLTTPEDGVLLQLRDETPGIEYPGYWSLIGGRMEAGEDHTAAIRRELSEELDATGAHTVHLGHITLLGHDDRKDRPWTEFVFHAQVLTPTEFLQIREGRDLGVFTFDECSELEQLAPHHGEYIRRFRDRIVSEL